MSERSLGDLRDLFRQRYASPLPAKVYDLNDGEEEIEGDLIVPERAFVMTAASGRTFITAPLREISAANSGFTYLRGRMLGADYPNANGAFWTAADLELGEKTVAGGPVNWLHDDTKIVGSLLDGQYVPEREQAASGTHQAHIVSTAAIWKFLFPAEAAVIEAAAADGQLMQSMECVSRAVACLDGPNGLSGCGEEFSYSDYNAGKTCEHLRQRSSMRRFVDPIFLGTAIIIPPVRPADAHASMEVMRQAAESVERAEFAPDGITADQAQALAATILEWANGRR
ncbi:hypothetical protein [Nocardioides maradonensis]